MLIPLGPRKSLTPVHYILKQGVAVKTSMLVQASLHKQNFIKEYYVHTKHKGGGEFFTRNSDRIPIPKLKSVPFKELTY